MRVLRQLVRAPLFAAWTGALWIVVLLGLPLARRAGRTVPWRHWIYGLWGRVGCALLGVRVEVRGTPPRGGFLLASNHLSYLDVLVLASRLGCAFVSKAEVGQWPVVGAMARSMGTLFVERARKRELAPRVAEMRARLAAGEGLVLFPEGTSTRGAEVLAFRPSLLEPAAALGLPVHALALRYATPGDGRAGAGPRAWHAVAWWGDMTFLPHFLGLCGLARIEARLDFAPRPCTSNDRKRLAQALERAVRERFEPLVDTADGPPRAVRGIPPSDPTLESVTPTR